MGQQQLLLVILVTIIVGIATVVALNVFGTQAEQANRDAVRQDILSAAANAQGHYIRPVMMGGGGNSFEDLEIRSLGIPGSVDGSEVTNENGVYTLSSVEPEEIEITAVPSGGSETIIATILRDATTDDWTIQWAAPTQQ